MHTPRLLGLSGETLWVQLLEFGVSVDSVAEAAAAALGACAATDGSTTWGRSTARGRSTIRTSAYAAATDRSTARETAPDVAAPALGALLRRTAKNRRRGEAQLQILMCVFVFL